jgi:starch synthase
MRRFLQHMRNPRVLLVTPEITRLPQEMGTMAPHLRAKAGGLADVSASLATALFKLGADVHVALPHYRRMFDIDLGHLMNRELRLYKSALPDSRIHLAQDRIFYYRDAVYSSYGAECHRIALVFQREVINNIVPHVNPDLIHCNDWTTGLIPAAARRLGIPSLFTVHNIYTYETRLAEIEETGIDAAEFWSHLYYVRPPSGYEETRTDNHVDSLASGIFAAHFVNTVSPSFLDEVCDGRHPFVPAHVRRELANKRQAGCAFGIPNAPDPMFDPRIDTHLARIYSAADHVEGKKQNKQALQDLLGLEANPFAPLLFWPSRLDTIQKGPELMTDILYDVVSSYWEQGLQLAVVANGPHQQAFRDVVRHHDFHRRVAVHDFDERLSHLAYAASDFTLMPSRFEPCGLAQMIGSIYGSLPIAHATGGLRDTVSHIDIETGRGNGFVFDYCDAAGLRWAIDEGMRFFGRPQNVKSAQVARIMRESRERFNHNETAKKYFDLYEKMLRRPLVASV